MTPFVLGSALAVAMLAACSDEPLKFPDDNAGGGGTSSVVSGSGGQGGGPGGLGGIGGTGGSGGMAGAGGGLGGAGGMEWPPAPPLRNPVTMGDYDLAYYSLILMGYQPLGATNTLCSQCHSLNNGLLSHWRDLTDAAVASCFADPSVPSQASAEAILDCLRIKPQPNAPFSTPKLGIYSAAAHLDWFSYVFDRAADGDGSAELANFQLQVAMPKNGASSWSQGDFDIVAEWFARGLPELQTLLPDDPVPGTCVPNVTSSLAGYIAGMEQAGWRALNENANLLMFGCAGAATTLDCLSSYPLAGSLAFGTGWEHMQGASLRVLRSHNYPSSFWTRSSADGRYVAHGGGASSNSTIIDLALDSEIAVSAAYDPAFFPDNSGFMFQGTPGGTGVCLQSMLSSAPSSVNFQEPQCTTGGQIGLYQQVGAALGGGDHWVVNGDFVSDNGGHSPTTSSLEAFFDSFSDLTFTPMVFDGLTYTPKPTIMQATPFEGDTVMSPSSQLLMSRVAGSGWEQNGFRLRRLVATPNGNSYTVSIPEVARYCIDGGKPGISYDERWAVLHRYVTGEDAVELGFTGPGDPAFAAYASQGAANVYLLDLLTGVHWRVTHMQPGQYALFPHFRSDGWIYFIVRTVGTSLEHVVASDAALISEN